MTISADCRRVWERYRQADAASTAGRVFQVKVLMIAIKLSQSCAGIAKSKSLVFLSCVICDSYPVVSDFDLDGAVVAGGSYVDVPRGSRLGNAVPNSILHQRLQDQTGDGRGKQ